MKLRFRNVGQGDTIIMESSSGGKLNLVIIDCKNDGLPYNAVISYLKYLDYKKISYNIKYFVLSHPHKDHCMGAIKLLQYLIKNNIKLEWFLTTFYFNPRSKNENDTTIIGKINKLMSEIECKQQTQIGPAVVNVTLDIDSKFFVKCLAPEGRMLMDYMQRSSRLLQTDRDSTIANMLSTLILISNNKTYSLLTSDTEKAVFEKICCNNNNIVFSLPVVLAQIPHHGSRDNYHPQFWEKLKKNTIKQTAVISVGDNKYGHPSGDVINHLKKQKFDIKRTASNGQLVKQNRKSHTTLLEISRLIANVKSDLVFDLPA